MSDTTIHPSHARGASALTRGIFGTFALLLTAAWALPASAQSSGNFEKQWTELKAAAKKEGQIVISTGAPEYKPIFDAFTKNFGVTVRTDGGSGSSRATRILAERQANRHTVDVGIISVAGTTRRLEPAAALASVKDQLIHPDVTGTSNWYGKRHWYVDAKGTGKIFVYSVRASNTWRFWYNTKVLSKEDVASLKKPMDFLQPKWKGKMADQSWGDPGRLGGMLEMYFAPDAGPNWIKKYFTEMDVTFTGDSRLEESWLIRGAKPLKWDEGEIGPILQKYKSKFPVEVVDLPRQRGVLEARGSECCITILDQAPHPNAAKLFVNWFLTREVQTMVHETKPPVRYTSLREDVPPGNTMEVSRRIPGKDYDFRDFNTEYRAKEKEARTFIIANYGGPKKKAIVEVHSGKVVDVKREGRSVTIDYKGKKMTARLSSSETAVTIAGKKAARGAVKVGMTCTFTYPGNEKVAEKVACK
ncbi:MAG: ABC transporter substrate-binding protein [Alphaproteobacteria bacterium]